MTETTRSIPIPLLLRSPKLPNITMGRGGRRNRKRKLSETEAINRRQADEVTANVVWWSDETDNHDPRLDIFSVDPTQLQSSQPLQYTELTLLRQYYAFLATKYNWKSPILVQSHAWPHVFYNENKRRHVAFVSATASGKTLVFGLPLLIRAFIEQQHGLVLVPTRELAVQVGKNIKAWSDCILQNQQDEREKTSDTTPALPPTILVMHGGGESTTVHLDAMNKALANHNTLLMVATPGRFLDVLKSVELQATTTKPPLVISTICFDEADRLALQSDLSKQVDDIIERIVIKETGRQQQQLCLCSATLSANARTKWNEWIHQMAQFDCVLVQIGGGSHETPQVEELDLAGQHSASQHHEEDASNVAEQSSPSTITASNLFSRIPSNLTQVLHVCAEHKKARKLITTLQSLRKDSKKKAGLGIIFFNRIKTLQFASKLLQKNQIACLELHSQMPQDKRERAVQTFSSGRIALLLATDVAARGLHIDYIKTIVNYDFPSNLEQYIHRCGRAGRNNHHDSSDTGVVYSFFTRNFSVMAKDLVALLRATNQHVDPNLLELAKEGGKHGISNDTTDSRREGSKRQKTSNEFDNQPSDQGALDKGSASEGDNDSSDNDGDDDDGPVLKDHPGNRVVLKRADNVSDASSDSDDDDEER
jgi:superfamily II DNA/RNA helicase